MKLVVTFFFLLCCFLPARHAYANKSLRQLTGCLTRCANDEKQKDRSLCVNSKNAFKAQAGFSRENADLFYAEDEDDEFVPRKQLPAQLLAVSRIFFPDKHAGRSDYLFGCRYLSRTNSCKYISHRVLKI